MSFFTNLSSKISFSWKSNLYLNGFSTNPVSIATKVKQLQDFTPVFSITQPSSTTNTHLTSQPSKLHFNFYSTIYSILFYLERICNKSLLIFKTSIGDGIGIIRGLFIIFFFDSLLIDDEPLWEPIEWSMVQSWILFIFLFGWVAENLIVSRYGSYTGRDKRIWFAWYKTFWGVELMYLVSLAGAILCVMSPFYSEVNYLLSYTFSWWNWYTRVFFFKFISIYVIVLFIAYILQLNVRFFNWKKSFFLILIINFFISYLLYIHFFMSFFGYFTNTNWYNSTRMVDYVQLSHEPHKWAWGNKKRDHFSYHKSSTVFWFKNDGPMGEAFMFIHFFIFLATFFLSLYWVVFIRRVYVTQEISYTYTTYAISSLKQFFYFFLLLYLFVFFSFVISYWRLPVEFVWILNTYSWFSTFFSVCLHYWELFI